MYTAINPTALDSVRPNDASILDVGCGTGGTASVIKARAPSTRIVGLNNSSKELDIASEHLDYGVQIDLNFPENLVLSEKFDLIICSHVLEHLINPSNLLRTLERYLNDDGRLVLLVPNFGIWSARLRVMAGRFRYEDHGLYDRTHLRFFTYDNLIKEVVPENFKVMTRIQNGHFPLPGLRRVLPSKFIKLLDRLAIKVSPNLFSSEIGLTLISNQDDSGKDKNSGN